MFIKHLFVAEAMNQCAASLPYGENELVRGLWRCIGKAEVNRIPELAGTKVNVVIVGPSDIHGLFIRIRIYRGLPVGRGQVRCELQMIIGVVGPAYVMTIACNIKHRR